MNNSSSSTSLSYEQLEEEVLRLQVEMAKLRRRDLESQEEEEEEEIDPMEEEEDEPEDIVAVKGPPPDFLLLKPASYIKKWKGERQVDGWKIPHWSRIVTAFLGAWIGELLVAT